MTRSLLLGQRTRAELNGWPATTLKKKQKTEKCDSCPWHPQAFPSLFHIVCSPWHTNLRETAQPNLSQWILFTACMVDWTECLQLSICFVKSRNETKVILYPKMKRWKKGQKHSIVINKTKSACTCTGYNTINNVGKNLAWRYVPGNYFVPSSCTRHNSGESNLHYSALDLETPSSSINGPDTSSIWGVIWSWWTFAVWDCKSIFSLHKKICTCLLQSGPCVGKTLN